MPNYDAINEVVIVDSLRIPSSGSDTWFSASWNADQYNMAPQIHDIGAPAEDRAVVSKVHDDTFMMTFNCAPNSGSYQTWALLWKRQQQRYQQYIAGVLDDYKMRGTRISYNSNTRYDLAQLVIERPTDDNATADPEDRVWRIKAVVTGYDPDFTQAV